MKSRVRRLFRKSIPWVTGLLAGIFLIDQWVWYSTRGQMYRSLREVPHHKVGLLLGTSKFFMKEHRINGFYLYRIKAAVELFRAGKIDYILVSGDNRKESYNEPAMMLGDLLRAGVPRDRIVLDYAGFSTHDSILRCRDVFGERDIVIISQAFHNARALFIANRVGVKAVAYNAVDVRSQKWVWGFVRERLARVKMLLDLMFGKEPHFGGPAVRIGG